ncbi:MAG TPA: Rossmann-like and DUF2520 domain-containing protein [Pyrinomonadaceae bacterium]
MKEKGTRRSGSPAVREGSGRSRRGDEGAGASVSPSSRAESQRSVVIVGAGRLGTALARALDACGYEVRALVCRTAVSARRAAARAELKTLALGAGQLDGLPAAGLLFVTTPDGHIAETAGRLAALSASRAGVALHASGALSSAELEPLRARGYAVGSMHPLAAVSEAEAGAESLRRAFYCVEGEPRAARAARRVVRDLGGRGFTVEPSAKALYHASAVMAAGHVVALFDVAADTLKRCGLPESRARKILLPLVRSAVENLSALPPARALTGSFARADVETVRRHLRALGGLEGSDALAVYKLLGEHSLKLAESAGADPALVEAIRRRVREA